MVMLRMYRIPGAISLWNLRSTLMLYWIFMLTVIWIKDYAISYREPMLRNQGSWN
jgi:hypothetical protein